MHLRPDLAEIIMCLQGMQRSASEEHVVQTVAAQVMFKLASMFQILDMLKMR